MKTADQRIPYSVAGAVLGLCGAVVLLLSFLAPYTETLRLPISENLYAILRTFCHQMPSRCLWYANSNFGLCSHCFGLALGSLCTGIVFALLIPSKRFVGLTIVSAIGIAALSLTPLVLDVAFESLRGTISPHPIRILTGSLASAGMWFFLFVASEKLIISLQISKEQWRIRP